MPYKFNPLSGSLDYFEAGGGSGGDLWSDPVDSAITFDGNGTRNVGTASVRGGNFFLQSVFAYGGSLALRTTGGSTLAVVSENPGVVPSGASKLAGLLVGDQSGGNFAVFSSSNGSATSTATDSILFETGNKTAGTGDSGDLVFRPGTSSGGSAGKILLRGQVDGDGIQSITNRNYIPALSSTLELGAGGWTTDNGAGGAASGLVAAHETGVNVLRGSGSLRFAKLSADYSGEFIKVTTLTIDKADRGKALFGSFDYNAVQYVADGMILEVYDNTNSAVLYSGPTEDLYLPNSSGRFNFVTYTEATTASIELRLKVASTTTTGFEIYFDEFKLGPAAQVQTVYRKSQTITLDNAFTAGGIEVERVGNIVSILSTSTLPTHASATSASSSVGLLPEWARPNQTVQNMVNGGSSLWWKVSVDTAGTISIGYKNYSGADTNSTGGGALSISYPVPDTTGPTLTENELSQQTVFVKARLASGSHTSSGSYQTVVFNTEVEDSHGAYNNTTGEFTALQTLKHDISATVAFASNGTGTRYTQVFVNGSAAETLGGFHIAGTGQVQVTGTTSLNLTKGDVVTIRAYQLSGGTLNYVADPNTHLSIRSRPDYTVLGAVKERNRVQTKILSADVTTNSTMSDLTFSNLVIGKWYEVSGKFRLALDTGVADNVMYVDVIHDSTVIDRPLAQINETSDTTQDTVHLAVNVKFKATATSLTFNAVSVSSGAQVGGNGSLAETYVQLEERNDLIETSDF